MARKRNKYMLIGIIATITMILCFSYLRIPDLKALEHVHVYRLPTRSTGLDVQDKISEVFTLEGAVFSEDGVEKELQSQIRVSLIHSYSPQTEDHFREMMIDPVREEHPIFANSPAILQVESGEVITVMRIWLEKEIWQMTGRKPHNSFQDNYFFVQRFDKQMNAITSGRVLGIPTPTQWTIGDGPIEPRIFSVNNTIYLTFNTGIFSESRQSLDSTFLWDLTNSRALLPNVVGGQPMIDNADSGMPRDKHWSAIVNQTRLYFTYNLDPLRVMQCSVSETAQCHFVQKGGDEHYTFKDARDGLRGGTPFVLYKYPYYISVAHGTYFRDCASSNTRCHGKRYYTTHIILLTIEPVFRIIFVSGNIPFPPETFNVPIVRYRYISSSFLFPVGLILEDSDSLVLGGHINDHSSVLYRISNISAIIGDAVAIYKKTSQKASPKVGMLQDYTRSAASRFSGFKLQSG